MKKPRLPFKELEKLDWEFIVKDRNGKILARKKGKVDSYLKNHMVLVFGLYGAGGENGVRTDGSSTAIMKSDLANADISAGEGETDYGIVFGTGSDPNSPGMYNLQSPISHGDGDNLLHYYGVSVGNIVVEGNTVYFEISRDAKNNGSVDITIYEAGLIVKLGTLGNFLVGRQVISGGITVPAGATLTFKFRPKITV